MPKLPSGRHVGLDSSPLEKIVYEAYHGIEPHELMAIDSIPCIFSHINVLFFRPSRTNEYLLLSEESITPQDKLESYFSGFNLISIKSELKNWCYEDQQAFIDFLNEPRTNNFFESLLKEIISYQVKLTEQPTTTQGMLALWWKLGIHPLQDESANDN